MSSIPQTSGIYKIMCVPTGKVYIGSSIDLRNRRKTHWEALRAQRHINRYLQNAWNKHGESAFVFEVIELVLESFILEREQYWLDKFVKINRRNVFNASLTAGSNLGMKYSDEARKKISDGRKGMKFTKDALRIRSESQKNTWQHSGYRKKMADAHSRHWIVTDPDGNESIILNLCGFSREHGLTRNCMLQVANGKAKQHKGWKCRRPEGGE